MITRSRECFHTTEVLLSDYSSPMLSYAQFTFDTDASGHTIGAVIS